MKLKSQIITGYVFMLSLILLLIINSIFSLNNLDKSSERILKENSVSIDAGLKMNVDLVLLNDIIVNYALGKMSERTDLLNEINFYKKEIEKELGIVENIITENGEYEIIQNIHLEYKDYKGNIEKILKEKDPPRYTIIKIQTNFRKLSSLISDLIIINQKASYQKNLLSRNAFQTAWIYFIIIGAGALLLAYITITKIPPAIIKPLETVTNQILEISNGNYGQIIEEKSRNELGLLAGAFNQMSNKLYEYQQSNTTIISAQKSRIESIVNSLNDAIIVLDEKRDFVLLNPKAMSLLGLTDNNLIGKSASETAMYNNLIRELLKMIAPSDDIQKEKTDQGYLKVLEDGREQFYSKEIIRVYDTVNIEKKSFLGYIIELKNITDFKEIDEAKSNFISTLSHEVRTPLSAMNMSLSLLLNNKIGLLNDEQEKIVISIKDEIQRLLSIISNLFDLSKFEAGHIKIHFQKTNLKYLINYSLAPFYNQINEKNIEIIIENDSKISDIKIDPEKISWVLMNLIGNAIRYTPPHGKMKLITIPEKNNVQFCVEDTGPGIEPRYIDRIFDRYFQIPGKEYEDEDGMGLGLAICKEIVQAHKGRIWATSEINRGTRFYFSIPITII